MIGVTQPRRVAAVSTATRVADELDTRLGSVVGYQVGRLHHRCITCAAISHKFPKSCTVPGVLLPYQYPVARFDGIFLLHSMCLASPRMLLWLCKFLFASQCLVNNDDSVGLLCVHLTYSTLSLLQMSWSLWKVSGLVLSPDETLCLQHMCFVAGEV